jgi:hypothetical protein
VVQGVELIKPTECSGASVDGADCSATNRDVTEPSKMRSCAHYRAGLFEFNGGKLFLV